MPFNLMKKYNSLLEIDAMNERERKLSLSRIFKRDFIDHTNQFRNKNVHPTSQEGMDTMEILFNHLTTKTENEEKHREFDRERSIRIHWIKHHLSEKTPEAITVFSVNDKHSVRTYIYDRDESYVIILEPKKNDFYYLLTAYYIEGNNKKKIENKIKRKLPEIY